MKTNFFKLFLTLVCAVFAAGPPYAFAADPLPEAPPASETIEEKLINSDIVVSEFFDGIADGIDLFLVGRRITDRRNETSVKLSNGAYYTQGSGFSDAPSIGVNLRLPNVEQYWNLKFTSYDQNQEQGVRKNELRQTPRDTNYGASVGLFNKLGDVRTAFEPRIELTDPLKVSHSLTFESLAQLKTYEVNPKLQLYATPDKGVGFFEALNFRFRLTTVYSITWVNEGEYIDKSHQYTATNGFSLGQMLTKKSGLSYGIYFNSNNRPNYQLAGYTLSVGYNQVLYNKILDYSLGPQLNFSRDNNFTGVAGFTVNINLNF